MLWNSVYLDCFNPDDVYLLLLIREACSKIDYSLDLGKMPTHLGRTGCTRASWCHLLTRSIQAGLRVRQLKVNVVDGLVLYVIPEPGSRPSEGRISCQIGRMPHSWLETEHDAIIDVCPMASVGGPIMYYKKAHGDEEKAWEICSQMYQPDASVIEGILEAEGYKTAYAALAPAFEEVIGSVRRKDLERHYAGISALASG
ncbi:MAG TPA: hypothetical protein VHD69_00175 [Candidatus Paceibacterota bacterium]|nr:hypothetical protein [Candidatus Paceibacterota bacterium]